MTGWKSLGSDVRDDAKATWNIDGRLIAEKHGDDTSLGMTKFYRVSFFKAIGGFVCELLSDGIPRW
jgi:hypothetical protein